MPAVSRVKIVVWTSLLVIGLGGCRGGGKAGWDLAAEERAWRALRALHVAGVEKGLAALSEDDRRRIEAFYAEREDNPRILRTPLTGTGTPAGVYSPGFRVTGPDLGLPEDVAPTQLARKLMRELAPVWRVSLRAVDEAETREVHSPDDDQALVTIEYAQRVEGLPVVGGLVTVHFDPKGREVLGLTGGFAPVPPGSQLPVPTIDSEEAAGRVRLERRERVGAVRPVVWSGSLGGPEPGLRRAWAVEVYSDPGDGLLRSVWIDGTTGDLLGVVSCALESVKRAVWDLKDVSPAAGCDTWDDFTRCTWCDGLPKELCTCPDSPAEAGCEAKIWRYSEASGCVADGDPVGEEDCGTDAQALWRDAALAYEYWRKSFGRDSWDGAGGYILAKANPRDPWFGGVAMWRDPDDDGRADDAWISAHAGAAAPQLDGHELGHLLQFGTMGVDTLPSFHVQGIDVMEHLADVHSFRYQSLPLDPLCLSGDLDHYKRFRSADGGQSNKFIGNCHGWLVSRVDPPIIYHGVKVGGVGPKIYDQIWYHALDKYLRWSSTYFDSWNLFIRSAYDLYGYSAPFYSAMAARDAIGGWTDFSSVSSAVRTGDRYPAVSWPGAPRGPCVFLRHPMSSEEIYYQCYTPVGWTERVRLNDPAVDPAASEPAATVRIEAPGRTRIYVFYRGTDDRIWYRRLDPRSLTVDGPFHLGDAHRAASVPAVAPIQMPTMPDRLAIIYHPLAHPNWFYVTYLDSTVGRVAPPAIDLGPAFDSNVAPSMVSYPSRERVYFFRPDAAGSASPHQLRYASYTVAGGWTDLTDLTQHFNLPDEPGGSLFMPSGIVRTDRGVALAEYGLTEPQLRMIFVTLDGETWYATLREVSSGVLTREGYHAVPLTPAGLPSTSAGGLVAGVTGTVLWHFLGRGWGSPGQKLYEHRTYGE